MKIQHIKQVAAALTLAIHFSASAVEFDEKTRLRCGLVGELFMQEARFRDRGMSPEDALRFSGSFLGPHIDADYIKFAINTVYFDPRFVNARGEALSNQMTTACLYPKGRFHPLS